MRRTEMLKRIEGNHPCLLCGPVAAEFTKRGLSDFAFLMSQVACAIWDSPGFSAHERATMNNALAHLVCSYEKTRDERSRLADSTRKLLLPLATKHPPLAEIVDDFLSAFEEPPDLPGPASICPVGSMHGV